MYTSLGRLTDLLRFDLLTNGNSHPCMHTHHRQPRAVNIDRFDVSRPEGPTSQDVEFYVGCSKGTYIRSLAHDMGETLGSAAHLKGLRRTAIGEFRVDTGDAWTVTELIAALIGQREIRQASYLAAQANEVAVEAERPAKPSA